MRWSVLACLVACLIPISACQVPVHSGYISMTPREPGDVDLTGYVGGGTPVYLGAGAQADIYATTKLSVPVSLNIGWGGGTHERALEEETHSIQWYLTGRAGLRLRVREWVSFGLGVSGGYTRMIYAVKPIGPVTAEARNDGTAMIDLELGLGHRWGAFGFSFAVRPTFDMVRHDRGFLPLEAAFAWYPGDEDWAIVASGMFGMLIPGEGPDSMIIGGAGAVGVLFQL